jgi:hypothetical protein
MTRWYTHADGKKLIDLFLLVVALLLLLVKEYEDRERQADRGDDVAQELPGFDARVRSF